MNITNGSPLDDTLLSFAQICCDTSEVLLQRFAIQLDASQKNLEEIIQFVDDCVDSPNIIRELCKKFKEVVLVNEILSSNWNGNHILYDIWNEIKIRNQQKMEQKQDIVDENNFLSPEQRQRLFEIIERNLNVIDSVHRREFKSNWFMYKAIEDVCSKMFRTISD